jgi:hypothetical protein
VSSETNPPSGHAEQVAAELDEPSARTEPEPGRETGATAAERAIAEVARELSEPERLDGSHGPAGTPAEGSV